ncbi:hypothetical protein BD311DRAFT_765471 [Dichomitus squalens]|uniref:Uncharacterized protein n=1 Tax=Dichomitus squalens TaxID=114155 RepID=A0A4Q9MGI7_9APHY|nr:hypothetical protein BD311DRAFT_765471 [Dichomitus squalens]
MLPVAPLRRPYPSPLVSSSAPCSADSDEHIPSTCLDRLCSEGTKLCLCMILLFPCISCGICVSPSPDGDAVLVSYHQLVAS